ncbi:MAG: hypothetical protein O9293_00420 [Porphyrobacter sp.]|nr:hypothetical protein [Porphyrobacter sp.]
MSSNATPVLSGFRTALSAAALGLAPFWLAPLAAQDDAVETAPPPADAAPPVPAVPPGGTAPEGGVPPRVNLMVTVPRDEPSQADVRECRDDEEAAALNGEIVVCRARGSDGTGLTGTREESQKRYAQETMLKGAPQAPEAFGIPDNGKGIGFGKPPPVAITVDFAALPKAPAGSDADRLARGLPALGQDGELTEEQERARREAEGIKTTVPARPRKKGG